MVRIIIILLLTLIIYINKKEIYRNFELVQLPKINKVIFSNIDFILR